MEGGMMRKNDNEDLRIMKGGVWTKEKKNL